MIGLIIWLYLMPNKYSVEEFVKRQGVICPDIVTKQVILETGHFTSYNCINRNNLFGLRHRSNVSPENPMGYYAFEHWTESVIAYKKWISKRHRIGETYYEFLERIGYAEAGNYINLLKQIK